MEISYFGKDSELIAEGVAVRKDLIDKGDKKKCYLKIEGYHGAILGKRDIRNLIKWGETQLTKWDETEESKCDNLPSL